MSLKQKAVFLRLGDSGCDQGLVSICWVPGLSLSLCVEGLPQGSRRRCFNTWTRRLDIWTLTLDSSRSPTLHS